MAFLKSLLPVKPVAELYTSIGYSARQDQSVGPCTAMPQLWPRFERARGARGMVMAVFTLRRSTSSSS